MFKKKLADRPHPAETTGPTHIHYHTSDVGQIIARSAVALVSVFLGWHGLVFMVSLTGARQPEMVVAQLVFWVGGGAAVVFFLGHLLSEHLDRYYNHREAMEAERTQQIRYRQLMAGSAATDSRTLGDQKRLMALIYLVMLDAYDYLAKNKRFRGVWRPWSRRSAGQYTLVSLGETSPVGEEFGARVRPWLEQAGVIDEDQINVKDYPDIASIQRLIYQPVLLNPPAPAQAPEWSQIEQ